MNSGAVITADDASGFEKGSNEMVTLCRFAIANAMLTAAIGWMIRRFRNFDLDVHAGARVSPDSGVAPLHRERTEPA